MTDMDAREQSLGALMAERRSERRLSQSAAARAAPVSRTTWVSWEANAAIPEDFNRVKIEDVLGWRRGSVSAILAGGHPTPLDEASGPDVFPLELGDIAERAIEMEADWRPKIGRKKARIKMEQWMEDAMRRRAERLRGAEGDVARRSDTA